MAGNIWEGRALLPGAVAATAAGDIWLSPSLAAVVPADEAWLGLVELHHAAIGDVRYKYATDAASMLPDEARTAYSSALAGLLGQIGVTGPDAGNRLLGSLCDAADLYGGFDGLEGPALSAYLSAAREAQSSPEMEQLQWLLGGLGMPDVLSAGYQTSSLLNPQSYALGFPGADRLDQLAQQASSTTSPEFRDQVMGVVREGVSDALAAAGADSKAFKDAANAFGSAADGAALGASLGSLLGPGGTVVGGLFGGLIGFFANLLGSDDSAQQTQRETARDVASGQSVTVHTQISVEVNGQKTVVNTDTTVTVAPEQAKNPQQQPPQGQCVRPTEVKCPVADDVIGPDFAVPYWHDRSTLIGTALPLGPGRDGLAATAAGQQRTTVRLMDLPSIDDLGILLSGGVALTPLYNELAAGRQPGTVVNGWDALVPRYQTLVPRRPVTVQPEAIIARLRAEGFSPNDTIASVMQALAMRNRH